MKTNKLLIVILAAAYIGVPLLLGANAYVMSLVIASLVIGGIAQPNEASVRMHERLGFIKVAHFSEVGLKFGKWIDVGYWQLTLTSQENA